MSKDPNNGVSRPKYHIYVWYLGPKSPIICVLGPLGFTVIGLQGHRVMGLRIWDVGG